LHPDDICLRFGVPDADNFFILELSDDSAVIGPLAGIRTIKGAIGQLRVVDGRRFRRFM
jgi:hypothetical protein